MASGPSSVPSVYRSGGKRDSSSHEAIGDLSFLAARLDALGDFLAA